VTRLLTLLDIANGRAGVDGLGGPVGADMEDDIHRAPSAAADLKEQVAPALGADMGPAQDGEPSAS
jgi:hypothetical protein